MHSTSFRHIVICIVAVTLSSCKKDETPSSSSSPVKETATDSLFVIRYGYIELDKIARISKFRSGIGHDYSDDSEQCRSMKHYFQPKSGVAWSAVKIFSPAGGTVVRIFDEWAGTQVQIQPFGHSAYTIIIFHIALQRPLAAGDTVAAGEQLGTHIGSQTMSDIAIGLSAGSQWRLVSYFDLISDSLFQQYADRGVASRSDFIISKQSRDADPLNCSGETFGTEGRLPNWVMLN
ncbi:MAG: hypothetical protein HYV29_06570 [Ignavibacteriales bacterium]|nr:hypothetical protein [Ignavibacteriales bacterium]